MAEDLTVPVDAAGVPSHTGGVLGLFRKWGAGSGSAAISFSLVEELFGPTKHQARIEVEAQRRLARPVPAPTDPPELPSPTRRLAGAASRGGRGPSP